MVPVPALWVDSFALFEASPRSTVCCFAGLLVVVALVSMRINFRSVLDGAHRPHLLFLSSLFWFDTHSEKRITTQMCQTNAADGPALAHLAGRTGTRRAWAQPSLSLSLFFKKKFFVLSLSSLFFFLFLFFALSCSSPCLFLFL